MIRPGDADGPCGHDPDRTHGHDGVGGALRCRTSCRSRCPMNSKTTAYDCHSSLCLPTSGRRPWLPGEICANCGPTLEPCEQGTHWGGRKSWRARDGGYPKRCNSRTCSRIQCVQAAADSWSLRALAILPMKTPLKTWKGAGRAPGQGTVLALPRSPNGASPVRSWKSHGRFGFFKMNDRPAPFFCKDKSIHSNTASGSLSDSCTRLRGSENVLWR